MSETENLHPKTTCVERVDFFLKKIKEHTALNAFIEVFEEEAKTRAALIDEKIKNGTAGKLKGMVIGLKDNICYKGHRVSASSKILKNFTSLFSATAVERILAEDGILIGRLNCDEFGMGSTNENSAYGAVLNFADATKVAGGSSGGCAVAVQAGLCDAALGSDTGGSVRTPASFCGVVGLKPTYGRVSRHGLIAYASSFDQIGILSNNVNDAALLLEVISGADNDDATASEIPVPSYTKGLKNPEFKKPSIAYFPETLALPGLDVEIKNFITALLEKLKNDGFTLNALEFPFLQYLVPAYYILTTAEASANLSRYDGVRFGHRGNEAHDMDSLYKNSRTEGFGMEVKRRIMLGTFVLSAGYQDAYFTQAQKVRRMIQEETKSVFSENDFILLPTTPVTAFQLGEKLKNPVEMYLADIFTVHANLAGIPAISLPAKVHSNGMPFGIQFMSAMNQEKSLLDFSEYLMKSYFLSNL